MGQKPKPDKPKLDKPKPAKKAPKVTVTDVKQIIDSRSSCSKWLASLCGAGCTSCITILEN